MELLLNRFAHSKEFGTFSRATIGDFSFFTVEQDWENNQPNISCIPNGEYALFSYQSNKYGNCYIIENELLNVAKYKKADIARFGCLIHAANKASQLQGCIAPGRTIGMLGDELAVLSSRVTLNKILSLHPTKLIITSNFPTFEEIRR